jgi:hypothetical protein
MIKARRVAKVSRLGAVVVGLVVALGVASTAKAASGQGATTLVEYSGAGIGNISNNGGTVQIIAGGQPYFGVVSTFNAACNANNQTLDTVKVWTSLAQATLLAGKQVKVYFTTCGGFNYINVLDLIQ